MVTVVIITPFYVYLYVNWGVFFLGIEKKNLDYLSVFLHNKAGHSRHQSDLRASNRRLIQDRLDIRSFQHCDGRYRRPLEAVLHGGQRQEFSHESRGDCRHQLQDRWRSLRHDVWR